MTKISNKNKPVDIGNESMEPLKRRSFLKYSGLSLAGAAAVLAGCEDLGVNKQSSNANGRVNEDGSIDLGSGDIGILNYAYALEQLESAFYTMATGHANFASMYSEEEQWILQDLMENEIIHREFYKTALGDNAIPELTPDFSSIDFGNREMVLTTAKIFEDTGVAAYNGAGRLLQDVNLLLVAGKVVSVEGRHVATLRDLINPLSMDFAGDDVVNEMGLDGALMPMEVLPMVQPYIQETLDGSNLPTE
jgi:hypothetical protein